MASSPSGSHVSTLRMRRLVVMAPSIRAQSPSEARPASRGISRGAGCTSAGGCRTGRRSCSR
jgi:hypothetical protein